MPASSWNSLEVVIGSDYNERYRLRAYRVHESIMGHTPHTVPRRNQVSGRDWAVGTADTARVYGIEIGYGSVLIASG